ncbi:MAG: hypothetical protein FJ040_13810 [Chloroflexi bacterium]|nr:hypothetical protein [Chloroflexota bacterium]
MQTRHAITDSTYRAGASAKTPDDPSLRLRMAAIHHQHIPALALIECEVLDALIQEATSEQIATFSQVHIDTVRRAIDAIEQVFATTSPSQIIDNCRNREWISHIHGRQAP